MYRVETATRFQDFEEIGDAIQAYENMPVAQSGERTITNLETGEVISSCWDEADQED